MPPVEIYAIRFANYNVLPHVDVRNWGQMQMGLSPVAQNAGTRSDYAGLNMSIERPATAGTKDVASYSMYLLIRERRLPIGSRFIQRVEFDLPQARGFPSGPLNTFGTPPLIEPWS